MTTLDKIRETLSARMDEMSRRFRVRNLAVFGSYARDEARPDSDMDLLVEFDGPVGVEFIDLASHLEVLLEAKVDLVSRNGIKPSYFERIRSDLKYV